MASEEIKSPPYPGDGVTVAGLYAAVRGLRAWAAEARDAHNAAAGRELIPPVGDVPARAAYAAQPVPALFGHLLFVRRLREAWDHLVRTYERTWDAAECVRRRVVLLQAAAVFVGQCSVPFEHREARGGKDMRDMQRLFDAAQSVVDAAMSGGNYDPRVGEDDLDGD